MNPISTEAVRDALARLNSPVTLADHPLARTRAVQRRAAVAGVVDRAIRDVLTDLIVANLAEHRGEEVSAGDEERPAAMAWLARDFGAEDKDRESWSCLYHRFVVSPPWTVDALAAVGKPGYAYGDRHIRRRLERGYALLAEALRQVELADRDRTRPGRTGVASTEPWLVDLPAPITRFFGRDREWAAVAHALLSQRLTTIVGPAGVGKTRLAREAVSSTPTADLDHGWWIALAGLDAGSDLILAVARQVTGGLQSAPAANALMGALRAAPALLVLDNCEHLLPDVADLVARLLQACPRLVVLATSREPLMVPGEHVLALGPLAVPDADLADVRAAQAFDSFRLLVDRMRLARPGLALERTNVADAVAICRAFDGLPLALELVGARVGSLDLEEIADQLTHRLDLADGPSRDVTVHHRSLRAALDWGTALLEPREQAAFRRLGVVRGAFAAPDLTEIVGFDPLEPHEVPLVLQSLERKSLVVGAPMAGIRRYRLLQVIREYAAELPSDADEREACEVRRLAVCARLAEGLGVRIEATGDADSLALMEAMIDDVVAAVRFALDHPAHAATGLRLAVAAGQYQFAAGGMEQGYRDLAALRDLAGGAAPADLAADAELAMAYMANALGDAATAEGHARAALAANEHLGREPGATAAGHVLATMAYDRSDLETAASILETVLAWSRAHDATLLARACHLSFLIAMRRGNLHDARAALDEGLRAANTSGHAQMATALRAGLGHVAELEGDRAAAEACFREALAAARSTGFRRFEAHSSMVLGALARRAGRLDEAEAYLAEASDVAVRYGIPRLLPEVRYEQAELALSRGDAARAVDLLATAALAGEPVLRIDLLRLAARILLHRGRHEDAARLIGAADAQLGVLTVAEAATDRAEQAALRSAIAAACGPTAFESAVRIAAGADPSAILAEGIATLQLG